MIILDVREQHRGRAHDCVVCGPNVVPRDVTPVEPPKPAKRPYLGQRDRCGAAMPVSGTRCGRPVGHPDNHRSFQPLLIRPRFSGSQLCGAEMRDGETCALRSGHKVGRKYGHRSRAQLDRKLVNKRIGQR